jgi:TonB family protein
MTTPTIFVRPPDNPAIEPDKPNKITSTVTDTEGPGAGPGTTVVESEVSRIQGGPGAGFPSTDDFYPSVAIFRGEKGVATVKACVDGRGRLTADPTIVESTGFARLDESALKLAKAGSGHYRATTEDGQPVSACYPFRIRFDLRN